MKKLGTVALMAVLVLGLSLYLGACSSGGGGGSTDNSTGGGGGTISTSSQAASASASGAQSTSLASNSGMSLSNLAEGGSQSGPAIRFKTPLAGKDAKFNAVHAAQTKAMKVQKAKLASAVKKAKAVSAGKRTTVVIPSTAEPCADGGSSTFSGNVDDVTNEFTLTMTYNQCRELDEELNGASTVSGTFSAAGNDTFTMKLGDADGTVEGTDFMVRLFSANYVDVYATYLSDMTLTGSSSCSDASCTTFTATFSGTGGEKYDDFINVYTFTYTNFSVTGSDTTTATGYTSSYTVNGGISESWSDAGTAEGASITFTSFVLTFTDTATYYEETADGSVTMTFTPVDYCYGGTFTIDTVTPVRTLYSTGKTTAGEVVINSVVTIKFNADGTVTVTLTGNTPATYASEDEFENVCDLQEKEPQDSTVTPVSTGTATTTGTTLLATLTWTGTGCPTTGCTSDMDLHLEYYASATTPPAGTAADWHISYLNSDPVDVLPNDDPNTAEIFNNAGETIGGNEGNLDYDDTDGYGPEHMTIDPIAAGYYVLYVDPFSMASETATVTVTVKIGGNAYSFPTHTFVSTDTAIHNVCDIRVEANGTVTILQPDPSFAPAYAPAVRAPKVRK